MPAQALYLKWRPQTFDDLIGQEHITRTLRNMLHQDRIRHAYLFSGPRGTGKTSMARLLAKAVNCQNPDPTGRPCNECSICLAVNEGRLLDLIEIDAASHTGVDDVRELRDKIAFSPSEGRYKVYIIDEVHRFSGAAFDALLKTLEEPPAHAIFVLATTEIAKVPATIKSRCLLFEFRRVPLAEVMELLAFIAEAEQINIDPAALELIAREGTGCVRDSISLLDQLVADPEEYITLELAEHILGTAGSQHVIDLVDALVSSDAAWGLDVIHAAVDRGSDPRQFTRQVIDHLRRMLLYKMGGDDLRDISQERQGIIHNQAGSIGRSTLLATIRTFNQAVQEWQGGWQPQLPLELAFLDSIKPVVEEEPISEPAPTRRAPPRTQDELPRPIDPEPAAPSPGAAAPDILIGEIRSQWGEIQKAARLHHHLLPALLQHALPRALEDDLLIIGVENPVFKQRLDNDDKRRALQTALLDVLGVPLRISITLVQESSGAHDESLNGLLAEDDVLAFGIHELGGEITDLDE